jgi:hypothetical protein
LRPAGPTVPSASFRDAARFKHEIRNVALAQVLGHVNSCLVASRDPGIYFFQHHEPSLKGEAYRIQNRSHRPPAVTSRSCDATLGSSSSALALVYCEARRPLGEASAGRIRPQQRVSRALDLFCRTTGMLIRGGASDLPTHPKRNPVLHSNTQGHSRDLWTGELSSYLKEWLQRAKWRRPFLSQQSLTEMPP